MFSIIIPLYNKSLFIRRAIDSVLSQTFQDFEIIVVDDGSTDKGGDLVDATYGNKVKLIRQTNQGVSLARNNGITKAKYTWIAFLDADDYWHSCYLESVNKVIFQNPNVGIIGSGYTSQALSSIGELSFFWLRNYFKHAIRNTYYFTSATCIKKSFFENNLGFDSKLKMGEDLDVWFRANLYFGEGIYISKKLVYYGIEDEKRAVNKSYLLEETLISKIIDSHYFKNVFTDSVKEKNQFELFREKWIYFNLFPLYREKSNKRDLDILLKKMPYRFLLVRSFYMLSFGLLHGFFSNRKLAKLFRNYMKFCFRYIYT